MRGSGIYSEDYTGIFFCEDCGDEYSLDGQTDDFGDKAFAECPDCGQQLEKDIDEKDSDTDDTGYDEWRESQLDEEFDE